MTETYISKVKVDLWKQQITLEWIGSQAATQPKGPFHCAPGRGIDGLSCDDIVTSQSVNTFCTPKGDWKVIGHLRYFEAHPEAKWVTLFQNPHRGIGLHYYPVVPQYPASDGCVRIANCAIARQIWEKTKTNITIISVEGELRPEPVMLRLGDRSVNVRKLQRQLTERGYSVSMDSDFGPATEAAVKQAQRDMRLADVDGIFGSATYAALFGSSRILATL